MLEGNITPTLQCEAISDQHRAVGNILPSISPLFTYLPYIEPTIFHNPFRLAQEADSVVHSKHVNPRTKWRISSTSALPSTRMTMALRDPTTQIITKSVRSAPTCCTLRNCKVSVFCSISARVAYGICSSEPSSRRLHIHQAVATATPRFTLST